MKCCICDSSDKWENVDKFRPKPEGMSICKGCGFISYPSLWKSEEEIKEYYRKNYRRPPTVENLYTGQRKLYYHAAFLDGLFSEWKKEGLANPEVTEIGAAFGMFLSMVKSNFPGANVSGTELTPSFRRNAWHEFGIKLDEEFDDKKKYDLIASYKVLEHMVDPEIQLRKYALSLKDSGKLYISVPTWFGELTNFGATGISLEYYYSTNHINVWTMRQFKHLLKKCGLEIVKENFTYYGETFLCKRNDELMTAAPDIESVDEIMEFLKKVQEAVGFSNAGEYGKAVEAWPNFPSAWVALYESQRAHFNRLGGIDEIMKQLLEPAVASCPYSSQVMKLAGDLMMRYNRYKEAAGYFQQALIMCPEEQQALGLLATCYRELAGRSDDQNERMKLIAKAREVTRRLRDVSREAYGEAVTKIYHDNSRLPTKFEIESSASRV